MKRILSTVVLVLLVAYIGVAMALFCHTPADRLCEGVTLELKDSVVAGFITEHDVLALLKKKNLNPIGRPLSEVSCKAIEEALDQHPLIAKCECYRTVGKKIGLQIDCRVPVLRVMTESGENYYVDKTGERLGSISRPVLLPVATGYINKEMAQTDLLQLALFLQDNSFWNAQIEQIQVNARHEIVLVPRVGNHLIIIGDADDLEYKFEKLLTFYRKAMDKVGWNRYSRINVSYGNQVIGTKRKE